MFIRVVYISFATLFAIGVWCQNAATLSKDRWADEELYGVFFNNYEPNFYTGFVPRVQQRERITIHLGRGNQLRVRVVLSDAAIDNYIEDQLDRHNLFKEIIDRGIITLSANKDWEAYHDRVVRENLEEWVAERSEMNHGEWRELNLRYLNELAPGRLFHITRDFEAMVDRFANLLRSSSTVEGLEAKLDLINAFLPRRILLDGLSEQQDAAFEELVSLAKSNDRSSFFSKAQEFFDDITDHIYTIRNGELDFYEFTTIYPAGTYDATTTYKGKAIPKFTTTGIWRLIPRMHGRGYTGMVDYISSAGYYGLMPMLPYQYAGGISYNAFHNPGISHWLRGHPLLPKAWTKVTNGSRSGKPFLRLALTSRGPVSHGCTRLNAGHMTEFREMLPSTSEGMEGIKVYMNLSHCYDVFDMKGDGDLQAMGVQYYFAFRHNKSRVANEIWCQNNREDFYRWMYGDEIVNGPVGSVVVKEALDCQFIEGKAFEGERYENIKMYEAPYEPEHLQFYTIHGIDPYSKEGMDFNRELRRVGHGYAIDREKLFLQ